MQERNTGEPESRRFYAHAPVTEAVLEIRFTSDERVDPQRLSHMSAAAEYSDRSEIRSIEGTFAFGPEVSTSTRHSHAGYLYKSPDGFRAYIARADLFAASRLAPYRRWEELRDEAIVLWPEFRDLVKPSSYTRLGLRYVNKLNLPLPMNDLTEYLHTVPTIADDLPQALTGYLLRLEIPDEDTDVMITMNQAMLPFERPDFATILLDIDVYATPNGLLDEPTLWRRIEDLHTRGNQVFESSITQKTRELID